MSSSLSNAGVFGALLLFSILLVVAYYRGGRKNLKIIKATGEMLEGTLRPADKSYTWLGGTIGFRAEYRVSGFQRVEALVTVLPRQSLLYMPFALLRGSRDRLELIFFLKGGFPTEFHLIRDSELRANPALRNGKLKELEVSDLSGYRVFVSPSGTKEASMYLKRKDKFLTPYLLHLALVPEKGTAFMSFRLPSNNPSLLSKSIKTVMREMRER